MNMEAEDIGGISVQIGASHSRLPGDLEEADRIIEAWAKEPRFATIGVQVQQPTAAQAQRGGAVAASTTVGTPAAAAASPELHAIEAQLAKLTGALSASNVKALRRAEQEASALGLRGGAGQTKGIELGDIKSPEMRAQIAKTLGDEPVDIPVHVSTQQVTAQINELRVQSEKPLELHIPAQAANAELQTVLGTLNDIAATLKEIAASPVAPAAAGAGGRGGRGGGGRGRRVAVAGPAPEDEGRPATPQLDQDALTRSNRVFRTPAQTSAVVYVPGRDDQPNQPQSILPGLGPRPAPRTSPLTDREQVRVEQVVARARVNEENRLRSQALREERTIRRAEANREIQQAAIRRNADVLSARNEANILTAGRTQRTAASTAGGFIIGPGRERLRLEKELSESSRDLGSATSFRSSIDKLAIDKEAEANVVGGRRADTLRKEAEAIRQRPDYKKALADEAAALERQDKAQANLDKFSKNPLNLARNLLAVTAAGLAFGAAIKIVDVGLSAVAPAIGDAIDKASGFGAVSNKVTQALAQQTAAAHGNVNAVLATADAQASLSSSAAEAIDNQLRLTTQVKAGAAAAGQTGGLFRAAIGANQQTPQGLFGGYGGLGGGALFAQQLGGGAGLAETIKSSFGDITSAVSDLSSGRLITPQTPTIGRQYLTSQQQQNLQTPNDQRPARLAQLADDRAKLEDTYNQAAKRGAQAQGLSTKEAFHFAQAVGDQAQRVANSNLPQELKDLAAKSNEVLVGPGGFTTSVTDATKGLEQVGIGLSITPPEQLGRANLFAEQQRQREAAANLPAIQSQQAYVRPSEIAAANRQTQFAIGTQLPAQAALAALANPNVPVGTGIARSDQGKVVGQLKAAQTEQQQLNAYYAQGQDIIENTYRPAIVQNFGQAAGQAFDAALNAVKATGQQIASIQAGISNEQAQYQVAQYNFQLLIAKRNLSDIGGLIGKNLGAGESELGILEHQNLLLSRQGQQLQFNLSQRQINFQQALAGFQAPGITPEERQARIAEAKIEAEYAQKQLNIQKQQFSNQVKIVDIGNLRQGADLVRQIALLTRGRQVTIDTAAREQQLLRLQQLQQQNVAKVQTYLNAVDKLVGQAFADIQQLEAAAGKALETVAVQVLAQFGIVIKGLSSQLAKFAAIGSYYDNGKSGNLTPHFASGFVGTTTGKTTMTVGEAQGETVAILRNPRAVNGFGGNGGGSVVVQFNGDIHTDSQASLEKVTQAVTKALGRDASLKGLRGIG